ncbi:hypothetical protein F4604DRAFT_1723095 [Suillus subluteus]|nr:hypothetical protein F4604DRAFT_1723095 [Suillus subluteus]
MRLSFRVVLAVVATLTVSMAVSADSECYTGYHVCDSDADCCPGYECTSKIGPRHGSISTKKDVCRSSSNELQ